MHNFRFLTVLLTLKAEANLKTFEPLQELTPKCRHWLKEKTKSKATTVAEVVKEISDQPKGSVATAIDAGIQK